MHSKNTKEMKMLFENWRSHNDVIVEQFGDPIVDDEYMAGLPEPPRPAGKEARMDDYITDILGIVRDFSKDISTSSDATTFILENDNGISNHLFIKTDDTMWRLSPDSDFPEQVAPVDLGPHPKFHVPSEIIKTMYTPSFGIATDPNRGIETPGAVGAPSTEQGVEMIVGPRGAMGTERRGGPPERPLVGPMREGLGDEPDLGYQGDDLVKDLLDHMHDADAVDKKVIDAAGDLSKTIDDMEDMARFTDNWIQGGELPRKNLRKLLNQFKIRYMTIIGLRQKWFTIVNRLKPVYEAIKMYLSAEARTGRKIAKALANQEKILARLAKKLDRKAFRYSARWDAVLNSSQVSKNARKAMRRAISWGLGPVRLPFNKFFRMFKPGNAIAILEWFKMAPYSQIPIDPGSRKLGTRTGKGREIPGKVVHGPQPGERLADATGKRRADLAHYDSRSAQRRTKFHGDDAIRGQRDLFYSEARHIDKLGDITEEALRTETNATQRRLLEIKLETQRMSAKIYRKIAHELGDTHKWARRGVRVMDTAKVIKTVIKTVLLTALWKTPQKGAKARKPVILLRILGAVFVGSLAWATFVEYYDRIRVYAGEEFALACVMMIENEPGLELLWGFSMGDAILEMFAEINKSAQQKVAAAGGDVQAANLDWDELGVWNNVQKNYSISFKPSAEGHWHARQGDANVMPMSPSLRNQLHRSMGDPEAQAAPGDWLYENLNSKSLKVILG